MIKSYLINLNEDMDIEILAKKIIGSKKFFVHKGNWESNYIWRIQKVEIRGIHIDESGKLYVEFGYDSTDYEYLLSYLKDTFEEAKEFALQQIDEEKQKQRDFILNMEKADE